MEDRTEKEPEYVTMSLDDARRNIAEVGRIARSGGGVIVTDDSGEALMLVNAPADSGPRGIGW